MTEDRAQAPWLRCQADPGCTGSALPPWGRCLAHLAPDDLEQAIKRAKTEGLDARGVTITSSLLDRILSLLDRTDQDAPVVPNARFDQATFRGDAGFAQAEFIGNAWFDRATFTGTAGFAGGDLHRDREVRRGEVQRDRVVRPGGVQQGRVVRWGDLHQDRGVR